MWKSLRTRYKLSGLIVALLVLSSLVSAQEGTKPAVPAEKPQVKTARGRLPAYFSQVVSPVQREEIYSIQARFAEPIERLRKELKELMDRRDQEVTGVLSEEQQQKVNALKEAARKRREARAAESRETVKPGDGPAGKPGSR